MSTEHVEPEVDVYETSPAPEVKDEPSFVVSLFNELIYNPLNLGLLVIILFLIYKIIRDRFETSNVGTKSNDEPQLPKIRRDLTVKELREFDGTQPDGRVLVAVNGMIYDVTKGKRFYGPGGPYATFAGRDASRNLATFSVEANDKDEYDDLSDLGPMEMDSVREWEMQFKEKYDFVGKLLRNGEEPTNYEDEDDDTSIDTKLDDTQPDDTKPDDTKPDDTKPDDTKPDDTQGETKAEAAEADTEGIRKRTGVSAVEEVK